MGRRPKIDVQRLTDGKGAIARGVTIDQRRQLVLVEVVGFDSSGNETGPLEVLVNNTKFDGKRSPSITRTTR